MTYICSGEKGIGTFLINTSAYDYKPLCNNNKMFKGCITYGGGKYPEYFNVNTHVFYVNNKPWSWYNDNLITYDATSIIKSKTGDAVLVTEDLMNVLAFELPDTYTPIRLLGYSKTSCTYPMKLPVCVNSHVFTVCGTTTERVFDTAFVMSGLFTFDNHFINVDSREACINCNYVDVKIVNIGQLRPSTVINNEKDYIQIIRGRFTYKCRVKDLLKYLSPSGYAGFKRRNTINVSNGASGLLNKDLTLNTLYIDSIIEKSKNKLSLLKNNIKV